MAASIAHRHLLTAAAAGTGDLKQGTSMPHPSWMQMLPPDKEDEVLKAYLFQLDGTDKFAVTLSRSGSNLPPPCAEWRLLNEFLLGAQEVVPIPISPEPILRGIRANGYFEWRMPHIEPFGTSQ
jgi:hypothetical protein